MNLSAENIGQIRELVRSGYPLKARDAKDLLGHNDHLVELLEARGRLMLGVEIERDQLKAENERQAAQFKEWQASHHANYCKVAEERDELRAEIAGLKTGYEAYERVNAELKAEVGALRKLGPSKEIIWCACGDGYPVNSYGAGFMDANNGVCANCDAALGQGEQP